eukprot:6180005-Pleurochrysis_carterae.AAC.4
MRSALSLALSAAMSGTIHSGAWRLWRKSGDSKAPRRSAGCSRMYLAPESRAAINSAAVRRTSSFASCSSRSWLGSTSGRPSTCSRSRTGGVPPSFASGESKKRATEKVEQEGVYKRSLVGGCETHLPHAQHPSRCCRTRHPCVIERRRCRPFERSVRRIEAGRVATSEQGPQELERPAVGQRRST